MLYLKKFNKEDSKKEYEFFQTIPEKENGFENLYYGQEYEKFTNEEIIKRINSSKGIALKEGHVPDTYYFLWEDDEIVGLFKIRHYLNDFLRNGPGHIGYTISPKYRGKGYASKGLKLAIEKLIEIMPESEKEIYMECNANNIASLKTMLKNGAYIVSKDENKIHTRIKVR